MTVGIRIFLSKRVRNRLFSDDKGHGRQQNQDPTAQDFSMCKNGGTHKLLRQGNLLELDPVHIRQGRPKQQSCCEEYTLHDCALKMFLAVGFKIMNEVICWSDCDGK
jgi:hypothetical protein